MSKRRLLVLGVAAVSALSMGAINVPPVAHAASTSSAKSGPPPPPPAPAVKHKALRANPGKAPTTALPARISPTLATPVHTFTVNSLGDVAWDSAANVCETAAGNGVCTLRAAIQVANAQNVLDKIVIPSGVFGLTIATGTYTDAATGPLKLEDTAGIILWGSGASGGNATIIDGSALPSGVLRVPDGYAVPSYITNLQIRGGNNNGQGTSNNVGYGGGIYNNVDAVMSLDNVVITQNTDDNYGGGVYSDGNLEVTSSTISNNTCTSCYAGGIYSDSDTGGIFNNDWFINNQATGNDGGGIYGGAFVTVTQCHFTGNSAAGSGGAVDADYMSTFDMDTFTSNSAGDSGGAVYADYQTSVTNSQFNGNTSTDAGAVYVDYPGFFNNDTFTGNSVTGSNDGGALDIEETALIQNSTFTSNTGYDGAAIYADGAPTLLEDAFNNNGDVNTNAGGAFYNASSANFHDVTFTGNQANRSGNNGYGGAIYNSSSEFLSLANVAMTGNQASYVGGGLYNNGYVQAHQLQYVNNTAAEYGGGLYNNSYYDSWGDTYSRNNATTEWGGGIYTDDVFSLENSTITGNGATDPTNGWGGGVYNGSGEWMTLVNDTIQGNWANQGGGVYNEASDSDVTATNLTIAGNRALATNGGGGWYNTGTSTPISGSIFADNAPDQCNADAPGDVAVSGGHNLDVGTTCAFTTIGDISNAGTAQLSPLADNGGPTWTMAIPATSLANNADGGSCPATDQRGVARPLGAGCDIGAYEFDGANKRFVSLLYTDLLGRPADTSGLAGWDAALRSSWTPTSVASWFAHSAEHASNVVSRDYSLYLQRSASPADVSGWSGLLQNGSATDQSLDIMLLSSPEYYANRGSSNFDTWLNAVYTDVLHRPLDAGSQTAADNAHAHGATLVQFATAVAKSTEAYSIVVSNWYNALLGRNPSVADSAGWVNAIQHGTHYEDALANLTGSGEYFAYAQSHAPSQPVD